ncbi:MULTISPECIES: phosphodiesterase [Bacillus cereus group]|uniref:Phosphodiesterase n=1 Tax=Bacillus cereus TaxID=1396 RepID=A0AA44QCK4_BACCE|nr:MULTISPECIES: phosphodiesterase [Bacillus cereus group]PFN05757.1 phosphodiesterase [Bacillus cereus]PFO77400.1 phosphodiesterase [Bacillus cereus]PFR20028.1 phosphodiesterase [Bacillus cereus]PFS03689.1 phosphodiesterase [Bacillus cereus]
MNLAKEPEGKVQENSEMNEMKEVIVSLEETVQELKEEVKKLRKEKQGKDVDFGTIGFWVCMTVIALGWFWGK